MRIAAAAEDLFERLQRQEETSYCVGVLEASELPSQEIVQHLAERTGARLGQTAICVASTASQAGHVQIVARSVETAMHKLFELDFDVSRIVSGWGCAPLPPLAADDLQGIGRTNDAILYGSRVLLWVQGDDASLEAVGPQVPACSSGCYGKPFLEIFEDAGRDFYGIDPHLFSPAEFVMINVDSGRTHEFGQLDEDVLLSSFGMESR
jgi:methenyltetrahydromethanopterin cyclohydrolase